VNMAIKNINSLTAGLGTSGESVMQSEPLARGLRAQIVVLAREAGTWGITINEAERLIRNHKGHSVSPRFSELVMRGALVRRLTGYSGPTARFPKGAPIYESRYDAETGRNVVIHWHPEFAPPVQDSSAPNPHLPEKHEPQAVSVETRRLKGVRL
jgi:hypothetical protein